MSLLQILTGVLVLANIGCATTSRATEADPYIWLEEVKSKQSLKWVDEQNQKSSALLKKDPRFDVIAKEVRTIITAKDRIPFPSAVNGKYRNFWQDEQHVRGIWRETTVAEYKKTNPQWDVILDIDELNRKEGKSWVFSGSHCLAPDYTTCLIKLSDGGKDEVTVREFDVNKRAFVSNGFVVPPAKTDISWIDKDTLLIGSDWGQGTLTDSGYPRQVRVWKRGQPLDQADLIYEGKAEDVSVSSWASHRTESKNMFVWRSLSFFKAEIYILSTDYKLRRVPMPVSADFKGDFKNQLIYVLREDLKVGAITYSAGTLLSLPIDALAKADPLSYVQEIFVPDSKTVYSNLNFTKDYLLVSILRQVRGEVHRAEYSVRGWKMAALPLAKDGMTTISDSDEFSNDYLATYESFLVPTTLYSGSASDLRTKPAALKNLPPRFNDSGLSFTQYFATSKDGTKVPYFVVAGKKLKKDGKNPTLMYGYGGFEVSLTPYYMSTVGKVWLEKGGVYVLTNIRGGGEFGPKWHRAALLENRQKAYDDFAAIAQDLFKRKITSPKKLGIMGGSNGGLLMGVAATQHPDYYNAVVCKAALLDMLRYHIMKTDDGRATGASWVGEYGSPDDAAAAAVISRYSPYQNVKPGVKYPKIFFYVSTADDRVHPGHARKMAARMAELGHDFVFYENTEGGHGGAADLEQRVTATALDYTYLFQQLF